MLNVRLTHDLVLFILSTRADYKNNEGVKQRCIGHTERRRVAENTSLCARANVHGLVRMCNSENQWCHLVTSDTIQKVATLIYY